MQALTMAIRIDIQCILPLESIISVTICLWKQETRETKVPEMTLSLITGFKSKLTEA